MDSSRIALGTAQFGLAYGIANEVGQVARDVGASILRVAASRGIDTLDTAAAYGTSEASLGSLGVREFRVVTKLPGVPEDCSDVAHWVDSTLATSLARLHLTRVHGLLLHRPSQLLGSRGPELYRALIRAQESGLVGAVGASIYDPAELDALVPRFRFGVIQASFNVLDRRLKATGWMSRLRDSGIEIHTRSAFLQGALTMPIARLPRALAPWKPLFEEWHRWLEEAGCTPVSACLAFVLSHPEIDRVVVGCETVEQLDGILDSLSEGAPIVPSRISSDDSALIDPSQWRMS
jgi:aryl-alcohol dehydrogenase-like predicted oxidoreductase